MLTRRVEGLVYVLYDAITLMQVLTSLPFGILRAIFFKVSGESPLLMADF